MDSPPLDYLRKKMTPWLTPVGLAADTHGVERCLLFGVLDRETLCGTSPHLDQPGPGGTGDFAPRLWSKYEERPELAPHLKHWVPTRELFAHLFPHRVLTEADRVPEICLPLDGRGWGRGGFQIDFAAHTEWCLQKLPDGRFVWEDPTQNADKAARILSAAIEAFGGDEHLAAASFNAGIKAIRRALLSVTEPAAPERRRYAADLCTTGHNYGQDVLRRRREFRQLLKPT